MAIVIPVSVGMGCWWRFCLVSKPMPGPTTLFVVVTFAANAFRQFEAVATLTKGGPAFASDTIV
ncbi:sugar ABC transporter permease [Salipiger mangrovisoli]|uniref:Sugar ABC transporter permease n=1 Tax=Salipiger mangrovisoli TaxID=2865933 RepID=A0ABR9X958_9RHOB|nr:sugar ABC transporter permease [Salipiger mangrovisoli]MBE9640134.1 sugar ABC transporter permease [Salipiger mangrovisoli]